MWTLCRWQIWQLSLIHYKSTSWGWLEKREQWDSNWHKNRTFLDVLLMHMLMSWMDEEREREITEGMFLDPKEKQQNGPTLETAGQHCTLPHHVPVSILMNNPAELHVRVRLSILAYRQRARWGLIQYFFPIPPLREEEMGEGVRFGQDCSGEGHCWFSLMKWQGGARSVNSIFLAAACQAVAFRSFLKGAAGRGSQEIQASGLIGILPRYLFPSDLEVTQRLVSSVLHACVICHHVSSWGRADMIPRLPKHCHKLKLASWENDNKVVAVWPASLFLDAADRSYIWKWKLWPPILTTHVQG